MPELLTPILLIAWRRPETVRRVIDALRPLQPRNLFIACDGPSPVRPGETELVFATRSLINESIDWRCSVNTLYSDCNQGCGVWVAKAISWFFSHVESGIVLEDDCVPHPDFFRFCSELLVRYRDDQRIWSITGDNFQTGPWTSNSSYCFTKYPHCWGWATWRRCWSQFDWELKLLPLLESSAELKTIFHDHRERDYWLNIWRKLIVSGGRDIWDYRWTFCCFINGGLTAMPSCNLVSNIGFGGAGSTNCLIEAEPTKLGDGIGEIVHPSLFLQNCDVDSDYYINYILPQLPKSQLAKLKQKLGRLWKTQASRAKIAV